MSKIKDFYSIGADEKKTPYKWAKGELEEYMAVCDMFWGGYPLDVTWARGCATYQEKLKEYKLEKIKAIERAEELAKNLEEFHDLKITERS